eukprot:TRINITY_DN5390_c0_g2_i1.p1 TRINITY_DN5390_c0_g2~~TRINITY_DN5390_c0_g2_i1.p1  ORF type:complete len:266 (+),score=116.90 TRINITY_DN5390_c0_g2_i1:50-847(+)
MSTLSAHAPAFVCPPATKRQPAVDGDTEQLRWCNFLYSSKCPFCVNAAAGTMTPCKFQHLDLFVETEREERPEAPHAMTRHVKSLVKEMSSIFGSQAKRQLTGWFVQNAWGGSGAEFGDVNPYGEVVAGLRRLGWVIPETTEKCTSARVEDAPYAQDVSTIVNVIANCLHYEIGTMPELMFDTIAWAFKLEKPAMRCPEVELEAGDIMEEFLQSEEVERSEWDGSSVDGLSSVCSSPRSLLSTSTSRGAKANAFLAQQRGYVVAY